MKMPSWSGRRQRRLSIVTAPVGVCPWPEGVECSGPPNASTGFHMLSMRKPGFRTPIAQLVLDLEERGLLDRTMIVLASEFSRDCMVEGKPEKQVRNQVNVPNVINEMKFYGMHRHFTAAGSVLMFGGGASRGHLFGETSNERPCKTIKDPATITDLHATIYQALRIDPAKELYDGIRPVPITDNGRAIARAFE